MNYFKGLMKCGICGKNHNYKPNNGQHEYLCSTRKNYGRTRCDSQTVKEQFLLDIIETHLKHQGKDFTIGKLKLFVKEIDVTNEKIKIIYKDGTFSEIADHQIIY